MKQLSAGLCPLTPALRQLLQACVDHDSTETKVLTAALHLSPMTVDSDFKRIHDVLEKGRGGAVIVAIKHGWVVLPGQSHMEGNLPPRFAGVLPKGRIRNGGVMLSVLIFPLGRTL